jgi:hypothetical protein
MTPPHLTPVVKQTLASYASAWSAAECTRENDLRGAAGQRQPGRVRRREQHMYIVARKPLP